MIIGVISDTHDRLPIIGTALNAFMAHDVELVVHAGDWKTVETAAYFADRAAERSLPVRGVLGNNDVDVQAFLDYSATAPGDFELHEGIWMTKIEEGRRLAAYHGHHKPTLTKLLADESNNIICLGHTHKPRIERLGQRLIVNPGSTAFAIPRRKDWRPTVAIIDTGRMDAEPIELA